MAGGGDHIWFNGKFLESEEANINLMTHALHYGTGIFEGIRAYASDRGNAIFRLDDHLKRFFKSAKIYRMDIEYDFDEMRQAIIDTVRKNGNRECYIRPLAFYANTVLGIYPRNPVIGVAIMTTKLDLYLGKKDGVRAKVSPWRKIDGSELPSLAKGTGQYANSFLATHDARMDGYDEAILLDTQGYLAEGPGENVFIVRNGKVFTPSLDSSVLGGITRDTVIELLGESNPVVEKRISLSELISADEAFFAGTAAEIAPILEIGGYRLDSAEDNSISLAVRKEYFDAVRGRGNTRDHWLTLV